VRITQLSFLVQFGEWLCVLDRVKVGHWRAPSVYMVITNITKHSAAIAIVATHRTSFISAPMHFPLGWKVVTGPGDNA
jgi:hypothetical protein